MKLEEIAQKITEHLKRLELDLAWNKTIHGDTKLFCSRSFRAGSRVGIVYKSYQGTSYLRKEEGIRYLEILESGFKGRHFEAFRKDECLTESA